jgi:Rod binding domain-containing protein
MDVAASSTSRPLAPDRTASLTRSLDVAAGAGSEADVRKLAEQLVSQTFFGTLLRQMRTSPWKDSMFSGGRGGEAFQQMHDQELVNRLGRGAGRRLVDSLVNQITGRKSVRRPYTPGDQPTGKHATTTFTA